MKLPLKKKVWAIQAHGECLINVYGSTPLLFRTKQAAKDYAFKDQKVIKVTAIFSEGWDDE
jgi:hypothetical protein